MLCIIETGINYSTNMGKFADEYKELYDEIIVS